MARMCYRNEREHPRGGRAHRVRAVVVLRGVLVRAGGGGLPHVVGVVAPHGGRARAAGPPHHRRRAHLPAGVAGRRALHGAAHGAGQYTTLGCHRTDGDIL